MIEDRICRAVLLFCLVSLPSCTGPKYGVLSEGPEWQQRAAESLTYMGTPLTLDDNGRFNETTKQPLCVRLNNYGCVKQGESPWNGSRGRRDSKGHAIFDDPTYSVRAVVRDYCSKHKRGVRKALDLADAYSPWCDTLGSVAVYKGWGRSCSDSPQPPAGFSGPLCRMPNGNPTESQCRSCNCPDRLAKQWLKGLERNGRPLEPSDDLLLFDSDGTPDESSSVDLNP